jgi:hypothetical protein
MENFGPKLASTVRSTSKISRDMTGMRLDMDGFLGSCMKLIEFVETEENRCCLSI